MLKTLVKVVLLVASMPAATILLGLTTVGCGCTHCCQCEYSCSGSEGSATYDTGGDGECLDCEDLCADTAKEHGCDASDVTSSDSCD